MRPKSHEIIAGVIVIVATFFFLLFLAAIGGGLERWYKGTQPAVAYFKNISALKEKVPVTYQGLLIGSITKIKYDAIKDNIRVDMEIFDDFVLENRKAVAIVTQATFLGDQYIEVTSQFDQLSSAQLSSIPTTINKNEEGVFEIGAIDPSSIGMIMTAATGVLDDVKSMTRRFPEYGDQIQHTLANVEDASEGVKRILGDPAFAADIKMTAENARVATGDIRIATAKLPATVDEAWAMMSAGRGAVQQIETMVAENRPKIDKILTNADELTLNARVLSYGLAESPWMLVWKDKGWQKRVQNRDPALLGASLYDTSPLSMTSKPEQTTVPKSNYTTSGEDARPNGFQYGFNVSGDR